MRALALAALILASASCTGENVDEDFVLEHGALLARVTCVCPSNVCGSTVDYWALMFLDGSVFAQGNSKTRFYERTDVTRTNAIVSLNPQETVCSGGLGSEYFAIESGSLNLYTCNGSPPAHVLDETMDLATDCTGFNRHLFD